jgi:hypothetical protein
LKLEGALIILERRSGFRVRVLEMFDMTGESINIFRGPLCSPDLICLLVSLIENLLLVPWRGTGRPSRPSISSTSWSRGSDAELIRQLPRHEGPNNCQTRSHHRSSARCGRSDKESQPRVLVLPRETYQSRRGFPQSRTDVDTQGEKHHAHRAQNPLRRLR